METQLVMKLLLLTAGEVLFAGGPSATESKSTSNPSENGESIALFGAAH